MPRQSYEQQEARLLRHAPLTQMERFVAYLQNPDADHHDLDDRELQHLDLLDRIDSLLRHYGDPSKVQSMINNITVYGEKLTRYKAGKYIREAQELFGSMASLNKAYWRSVLLEKAMKVFRRAFELDDLSAAAQALKTAATFLMLDQPDEPMAEDQQPNTYVVVIRADGRQTELDLTNIGYLSQKHREELVRAAQHNAIDAEWMEIERGSLPQKSNVVDTDPDTATEA